MTEPIVIEGELVAITAMDGSCWKLSGVMIDEQWGLANFLPVAISSKETEKHWNYGQVRITASDGRVMIERIDKEGEA